MPARVRLIDLAADLGMAKSTVSMALRNHPTIAQSTREAVQARAQALGYIPDPALRRLAQQRWKDRELQALTSLAFIVWDTYDYPNQQATFRALIEDHVRDYGYGFETLTVSEVGSPRRAAQILLARGVSGIIALASQKQNAWKGFDWEDFSGVEILAGSGKPTGFHGIRSDVFGSLLNIGDRILENPPLPDSLGIALYQGAYKSVTDERWDGAAGLVTGKAKEAGVKHVIVEWLKGNPQRVFEQCGPWYAANPVQCLVVMHSGTFVAALAEQPDLTPPGFRMYSLQNGGEHDIPGYRDNQSGVIERAVSLLDSLVRQDIKGLPAASETTVIPPTWFE